MLFPATTIRAEFGITKALVMQPLISSSDRINPGAYVFEYDLRASQKGDFANGFTTIQAMYMPGIFKS